MHDVNHIEKPDFDKGAVRDALREDLIARGCNVASDTLGSRGELYIMGDNDLAAALFEFKTSAREVFDSMYHGSWTEGLPPRFAVLPKHVAEDPEFEMIEQMRVVPLLYERHDGRIEFADLDRLLAEVL